MIYFDIIFFIFSPDQGTTGEMVDFYVVQTPSDGQSQGNSSPQTGASTPTSGVHSSGTGRSTHMVRCNSQKGVLFCSIIIEENYNDFLVKILRRKKVR